LAIKVKAGTTGCNITCPELDEVLADATATYKTGVTAADKKGIFEGEQSNPDKEYDANGDMYLTWYVQISEKNFKEIFNFTLTNQLNSQDEYISHFQLWCLDPKLNPLWWVSKGNVNSSTANASGEYTFAGPRERGYYFKHSTAVSKFAAQTTLYDGWKSAGIKGTDGNLYHLPTKQEWLSIVGGPGVIGGASEFSNVGEISSNTIISEDRCYFGYSDVTKNTGVEGKSYWKPTVNDSVRYGIRFLGEDYCSVWRITLEPTYSCAYIRSRLIPTMSDANTTENLSTLSDFLQDIIDNESDWRDWVDNDVDCIVRSFYTDGCITGRTEGTVPRNPGEDNHYFIAMSTSKYTWAFTMPGKGATASSTNPCYCTYWDLANGRWWDNYCMTVRLFRDE